MPSGRYPQTVVLLGVPKDDTGWFTGRIEDDKGTLLWSCDHRHYDEFHGRECAYKESRRQDDWPYHRRILTLAQVEDIRSQFAGGGRTLAALGREFGVSKTQISNIVKGHSWRPRRGQKV